MSSVCQCYHYKQISKSTDGCAVPSGPFQHLIYGLEAVALFCILNPSLLTKPLPLFSSQLQLNIEHICLDSDSSFFHFSLSIEGFAFPTMLNAALLSMFTQAHTWEQNSTLQGLLLLARTKLLKDKCNFLFALSSLFQDV